MQEKILEQFKNEENSIFFLEDACNTKNQQEHCFEMKVSLMRTVPVVLHQNKANHKVGMRRKKITNFLTIHY